MTILVACGLKREARLIEGPGVVAIVGGGDSARLEAALERGAGEGARAILSSGVAGALDPALVPGDLVIGGVDPGSVSAWVEKLRQLFPEAMPGAVVGSETPIASVGAKARLRAATGALAVDMESHVAARVAARHGLPFAALRVISDGALAALPHAARVGMRPDGGVALGAILASLARDPGQLPALIRTGIDAGRAFRALGRLHYMLRRAGIGRLDLGEFLLDVR